MIYTTGSGKIEIEITKKQALKGYHSGQCDQDIAELRRIPAIKRQLAKIDKSVLIDELKHWGAWADEELQDHEENLYRILWLACADIVEAYLLRNNKMYIIKRVGGKFVADQSIQQGSSYTTRLQYARFYKTLESAQADVCKGIERIIPLNNFLR